jgi:hypothetical protein
MVSENVRLLEEIAKESMELLFLYRHVLLRLGFIKVLMEETSV